MNDELEFKIVLLGQTGVGKTCIVNYFVSGKFEDSVAPTLGASYASKTMMENNHTVSLQIWDTAGQERFKILAPMYFRDSHAAILVYSITSRLSFEEIDYWSQCLREKTDGNIQLLLVANKVDLNQERQVSEEEGITKAEELGAFFIETSALLGLGIDDLFATIAKKCLEMETQTESTDDSKVKLPDNHQQPEEKSSCC